MVSVLERAATCVFRRSHVCRADACEGRCRAPSVHVLCCRARSRSSTHRPGSAVLGARILPPIKYYQVSSSVLNVVGTFKERTVDCRVFNQNGAVMSHELNAT